MDTTDVEIKKVILKTEEDEDTDSESIGLVNELARTITSLLCHKVSTAAYQRYAVRTSIIEVLREWTRVPSRLSEVTSFTDGEKSARFVSNLLNKHLTDEILTKEQSVNTLQPLAQAMLDLSTKSKHNFPFTSHLEKVIRRIVSLENGKEANAFLCSIVNHESSDLFSFRCRESIHISQRIKLIEEPLIDHFRNFLIMHQYVPEVEEEQDAKKREEKSVEKLLDYASESPAIFQLSSSVLKELLTRFEYSAIVLEFIRSVLKQIAKKQRRSDRIKNSLMDLYPRKLRSTVILLRIDPERHTEKSKDCTLNMLKQMLDENEDDALILLSHFPKWLEVFSIYCSI